MHNIKNRQFLPNLQKFSNHREHALYTINRTLPETRLLVLRFLTDDTLTYSAEVTHGFSLMNGSHLQK